jgi:hypothetical protein
VKITKNSDVTSGKKHTLYAHWAGPKGNGATITKSEYNKITKGMSYSEVKFLIGGKGKLKSSSSADGYTEKVYSWKGNGSAGSNAVIKFANGEVRAKSQTGLR